jgi:hypothetical protein
VPHPSGDEVVVGALARARPPDGVRKLRLVFAWRNACTWHRSQFRFYLGGAAPPEGITQRFRVPPTDLPVHVYVGQVELLTAAPASAVASAAATTAAAAATTAAAPASTATCAG